jgi:hypothetical protein
MKGIYGSLCKAENGIFDMVDYQTLNILLTIKDTGMA